MKKVLAILLALAMVFSMAGVVSADITGGDAGGSDDMEVSHEIAQSFVVTIPVDVAFNNGLTSEQAVTASNVLIPSKYILNVAVASDNDFILMNGSGLTVSTIPYTVTKWDGTTVVEGSNDIVLKVTEGVASSSAKITFATNETDIANAVLSGKHTDRLEFTVGIELDPTATDVLKIGTADQLYTFAKFVNEGKTDASGKLYAEMDVELTNNIDLENEEWTPIGIYTYKKVPKETGTGYNDVVVTDYRFKGTFNGQGYTISNLKITKTVDLRSEEDTTELSTGFFSVLDGTVKNVVFDGASVIPTETDTHGVGVVAGKILPGNGNVEKVTVKNANVEGKYNVGTVVGTLRKTIDSATVINANVKGAASIGGIVGYAYGNVINSDISDSTIIATPIQLESGKYDDGNNVGGIVGYLGESSPYKLTGNTVSDVTLKAYRDVGGVAGTVQTNYGVVVEDNEVSGLTILLDRNVDYYTTKDENANGLLGRQTPGILDLTDKGNTVDSYTLVRPDAVVSTATELTNAVSGSATTIFLAPGEYDVKDCGGTTLTLYGTKDTVLKLTNEGENGCDYGFGSSATGVGTYTFNGITIDTTGNTGNYKGYAYMKGTFNDCNFVGAYSLNNANDFVFTDCTFNFNNGYIWTWGAESVTFDGCTFTGNSKAILAHGSASTSITINDCTFAATEKGYAHPNDWTAVVEIDPTESNTYTITFTGDNTKTDSYSGWTRVKDGSTGHTITNVPA